jgi:hypothetical protein
MGYIRSMRLVSGARLGPYEVLAPLGTGGMGEVYRARDTRLGRDVAIKILSLGLSASPALRSRFEREARAIAGLGHPHICTLYDVGREGDVDFLVMELIEGETLTNRIARGPLPLTDVLAIGIQIADALSRAHRAGIVHRDLKPGNVMLTKSGAKLMDFGLARATSRVPAGPGGDLGDPSTRGTSAPDRSLTSTGTLIGTFQYIAPEQLEGADADARSDVWALGCVLYEMATGKRAFDGATPASQLSAILRDTPPPIAELAPAIPASFERVVRECLRKDPNERVESAHDVKLLLRGIAEDRTTPSGTATDRRPALALVPWLIAGLATIVALGLATRALDHGPRPETATFELAPPLGVIAVGTPRLSPDGQILAVNCRDSSNTSGIWIRKMNALALERVAGTDGAGVPIWSPDSRMIAFFADEALYRVDITGVRRMKLCDAPRARAGTWGTQGIILFSGVTRLDSIQAVSAAGGTPTGATRIDRSQHETGAGWPQFLPDGRHFLFVANHEGQGEDVLKVGRLGSNETTVLDQGISRGEYASGHLLYERDGALLARRFDPNALRFRGDPFTVVERIRTPEAFTGSANGTLAYRTGWTMTSSLVWLDRTGRQVGSVGGHAPFANPVLSPDGTRIAVRVDDPANGKSDIWVWDLKRDIGARLASMTGDTDGPTWAPDGRRVAYAFNRDTISELRVASVGGVASDSLLLASDRALIPGSWSRDGRWLTYMRWSGPKVLGWDVYGLPIGAHRDPVPLVATPAAEGSEAISPDGKWLAYISDESGRFEIYVQSFPEPSNRVRISSAGGIDVHWRGDSKELYYVSPENKVMAVSVGSDPSAPFSRPRELFARPAWPSSPDRNRLAVAADGGRFLFKAPDRESSVGSITVVQEWLEAARGR